jgi:putative redox protein
MTTISCRYDGHLRCHALHGPSGSAIVNDAPTDNQGKGERFYHTDLVATALATCILTIMGITADRHGWRIEGSTARVEKVMTSTGVRRIETLKVWITVPPELGPKAQQLLQAAGEGCPVKRSLEGAVAMELHWAFGT